MKGYLSKFVEKKKLAKGQLSKLPKPNSGSFDSAGLSVSQGKRLTYESTFRRFPEKCPVCKSILEEEEMITVRKSFCPIVCPFVFFELKTGMESVTEKLLQKLSYVERQAKQDAFNEREAILVYEGFSPEEAKIMTQLDLLPQWLDLIERLIQNEIR